MCWKKMCWKNSIEKRPDWDEFYLTLAFVTSQRSIDPRTCHGSCWVSEDNKLLSLGYNGPAKSSQDDQLTSLLDTDLKYGIMIHAEQNAILNYNGSISDTKNSTMYITGPPCHSCINSMIQKGINKVVHGHVKSKCMDTHDQEISKIILSNRKDFVIKEFEDTQKIINLLEATKDYIEYKNS